MKVFFQWQSDWWLEKATDPSVAACNDPVLAQGMIAYAHRQSRIRLDMLEVCTNAWHDLERYAGLGVGQPEGDVFVVECH